MNVRNIDVRFATAFLQKYSYLKKREWDLLVHSLIPNNPPTTFVVADGDGCYYDANKNVLHIDIKQVLLLNPYQDLKGLIRTFNALRFHEVLHVALTNGKLFNSKFKELNYAKPLASAVYPFFNAAEDGSIEKQGAAYQPTLKQTFLDIADICAPRSGSNDLDFNASSLYLLRVLTGCVLYISLRPFDSNRNSVILRYAPKEFKKLLKGIIKLLEDFPKYDYDTRPIKGVELIDYIVKNLDKIKGVSFKLITLPDGKLIFDDMIQPNNNNSLSDNSSSDDSSDNKSSDSSSDISGDGCSSDYEDYCPYTADHTSQSEDNSKEQDINNALNDIMSSESYHFSRADFKDLPSGSTPIKANNRMLPDNDISLAYYNDIRSKKDNGCSIYDFDINLPPLTNSIKHLFYDLVRDNSEGLKRGLTSGDFDLDAYINEKYKYRFFMRNVAYEDSLDLAVSIVVDCSGSMEKIRNYVNQICYAFSFGLETNDIPNEVIYFDSYFSKPKAFDQKVNTRKKHIIAASYRAGGTELSPAYQEAIFDLRDRKEKDKLVIIITDGGIWNEESTIAMLSQMATALDINTFGIQIVEDKNNQYSSELFRYCCEGVVIEGNNILMLPNLLQTYFVKAFKNGKL